MDFTNYSNKVWDALDKDRALRQAVARGLNVGEQAVEKSVERRGTVLTKYAAYKVIKEYLDLTDEEIFDQCPAQA